MSAIIYQYSFFQILTYSKWRMVTEIMKDPRH